MDAPPQTRRGHILRRHIRARRRALFSFAVGAAVGLALPASLGTTIRSIVGWDVSMVLFLALVLAMVMRATPASMRHRAESEDEGRWAFLLLMAGAAFFSMFAILGMLREAKSASSGVTAVLALLAGATILLSWLTVHTVFAVHYALDYFRDVARRRKPGLAFPEEHGSPDYWDFLYFSFVIGMTCQVSDVQVLTQPWRRLVLAHGFVSFLFNTVVLALSINLMAGLF
ncbi:MAG TPA: DUF1345 domain-containing protein [Stellaceae bacterium]|nr:DUF1345 domain-containing protein [Stellaceae bacterium]